jgi:PAS domain S-box-containing protein
MGGAARVVRWYRTLYDLAPVMMHAVDASGRLLSVNDHWLERTGFRRREVLGREFTDFMAESPGDRSGVGVLVRLRRTGRAADAPFRMTAKSGGTFDVLLSSTALLDEDGRFVSSLAVIVDVTEQLHNERLLQIQRDLATDLGSVSELNAAFERILEAAKGVEGIDCGGVYVVDPASGDANLAVHRGLSDRFVQNAGRYPAGSPQAHLMMAGAPIYREFKAFEPRPSDGPPVEGLRMVAIIPVLHEGRVAASLNLGSRSRHRISRSARHALETIASQIGGTVARVRAGARLAENRRQVQTLFDTIEDFLFILDAEGTLLRWNPVVERRLGHPAAALRGMRLWDLHPPDRRGEAAAILRGMGPGGSATSCVPLLAKDGSLVSVETRFVAGRWGERHAVFGISRDVSDRMRLEGELRRRLREKEVLLREVHHRVKNNMQVISSLLRMQSRYLTDERSAAVFRDSQDRIASMALIHEHLYTSGDLGEVDFQGYLGRLVDQLRCSLDVESGRVAVDIRAEPLSIPIDTAVPCGLVVNELVSNAFQHAFPGRDGGRVSVSARRTPEGWVELSVADDGVGLPAAADLQCRQTLGLQLVGGLVEHQLSGRLAVDRARGTVFRIHFPVP